MPRRVCSDTVRFTKKLPMQLVAAFSAGLEEVKEVDVLVHRDDEEDKWGGREWQSQRKWSEVGRRIQHRHTGQLGPPPQGTTMMPQRRATIRG
jgi:50S ribosomal subunit-associated GTPase HflX